MKIPYLNIDFNSKEQAAGFPPFTRGYQTHSFSTEIISDHNTFDFSLQSNSSDAIYKLFLFIIKNDYSKPQFHLLLDFPINAKTVVITKALRTILALINMEKNSNAETTKFHFYTKNEVPHKIVTTYNYTQLSQINTLITNNKCRFLLNAIPLNQEPIDSLYGSELIRNKVELLTTTIWKQIYMHFNE